MPGQTGDAGTGVGRSLVPLRPLGLAEVLDAAVTVTRAYPKATLGPSLVVYGGTFALLLGLASLVTAIAYASDSSLVQALEIGAGAAGLTVSSLLGDAGQVAVTALFCTLAAGVVMRALLGRPAGFRDVWRDTRRSFGWACLYALMLMFAGIVPLAGLLLSALLVAVAAVGVYLYVAALVAVAVGTTFLLAQVWLTPSAIVCERIDVIRGIARSWRLTAGNRWRATGQLALAAVIGILLWAAISAGVLSLLGILAQLLGATLSSSVIAGGVAVAVLLGSLMVSTVVTPFLSVVASVAYFDQRMRTEGFDITLTQLRTAGGLRGLPATTTLVGPATPFASPGDRRPPAVPVPAPPRVGAGR
ncbi:MAG: hypothetical protein J2P24_18550 [Streptosporangiales bacterium]|nr:hypothetical protein [Streptosporangiales bacterium]MBO0890946.1 hypothetical protein [Acidothermales bacterium]